MKITNRPKKKVLLMALLGLTGSLALLGGSYAAYTNLAYQRGVVRNGESETIRFTSNYLQTCAAGTGEINYPGRTVLFSDKEKKQETVDIDLEIYNYVSGTKLISEKDITYTLNITLTGNTQNRYKINNTEITDNSYSLSDEFLAGREANSKKYTLTIPGEDIDKVQIIVTAIPDSSLTSVTNGRFLAAVLAPCTGSATNTFTSQGEFIDQLASPTEYSGFNYEISISTGTATGTLIWDEDLEIDTYFLKNLGKSDEEIAAILEKGSLQIPMNQSKGTGDYLIPFYIKNKGNIPDNWDAMKKKITFSAVQTDSGVSE